MGFPENRSLELMTLPLVYAVGFFATRRVRVFLFV
jgi:hypothetical protein